MFQSSPRRASAGSKTCGIPLICWLRLGIYCIGDGESDIYELFCFPQELGTKFFVRSSVNRLAGDGSMSDAMVGVKVHGVHHVEARNSKSNVEQAAVRQELYRDHKARNGLKAKSSDNAPKSQLSSSSGT